MKKIGEYVIYQKDICKIQDIKENDFTNKMCYTLIPIQDESLKLTIPVDNKGIQDLITKEEIKQLIKKIPNIKTIEVEDKQLENEYKRLMSQGTKEDIIAIIKTTYLRNEKRLENKKKISEKDNKYFKMAEEFLYNEIGIVLNMTKEQAKEYVIKNVK